MLFCGVQDKVEAFWRITQRELAEQRAETIIRERQIEEAHERHHVELKVGMEAPRAFMQGSLTLGQWLSFAGLHS
jgi:hypothetical protein